MLLLRNPGRANGGLFARAYPFARMFGIDTVTPETQVTSSGGIPILGTGLSLGGANLIPIKVDATVEYDLLSDFAAWPNPFSLANNLMGFLLPTYILRGVDTSRLTPQLTTQLTDILSSIGTDPLALNLYLTLPANSLPLLEPLYLLTDLTNLLTLGAFPNPLGTLASRRSRADQPRQPWLYRRRQNARRHLHQNTRSGRRSHGLHVLPRRRLGTSYPATSSTCSSGDSRRSCSAAVPRLAPRTSSPECSRCYPASSAEAASAGSTA